MLIISSAIAATAAYAKNASDRAGRPAACETPPAAHCPDAKCPGTISLPTGIRESSRLTGRRFFLDYPCNLKRGEKITFILSLHGAGSYGNWQRHYFPIVDYKDKYSSRDRDPDLKRGCGNQVRRLTFGTGRTDDAYLQNIVNLVHAQASEKNLKIKAFWLVGHSQGGATSSRLIRTDFFKDKTKNGFLSLSGGRIGGSPGRGRLQQSGGARPVSGVARGAANGDGRARWSRRRDSGSPSRQRFFVHL